MIKEFDKKGIYFVALGGAEEVGFNMFAYIVNQKIIVVDAGYGFLQDDYPGMEMGLADASFLENCKGKPFFPNCLKLKFLIIFSFSLLFDKKFFANVLIFSFLMEHQ